MERMYEKKFFVFILTALFVLFIAKNNVYANNEINYLGGEYLYLETELKSKNGTKIIIDDSCVPIFREAGVNVIESTREEGSFIFKKKYKEYSYVTSSFVKKIVSTRKMSDDVDSIIYMVKRLEWYADNFDNKSNLSKKDLVIGYLRCINPNYKDGYSNDFEKLFEGKIYSTICQSYNLDFVNYVNENENAKFPDTSKTVTIEEYFKCFLKEKNKEATLNFKDIKPKITNASIDLIHLFCVIDVFDRGFSNISLQMVMSWMGDLHQGSQFLKSNEEYSFIQMLNIESSGCSYSDIIADIDGINIALALSHAHDSDDSNKLSDCMNGYYRILYGSDYPKDESEFRYKIFAKKMAQMYDEKNGNDKKTEREKVNHIICDAMLVNSDYSDCNEAIRNIRLTSPYYYYLKKNGICSFKVRKTIAKGFMDFIFDGENV